MYKFINMDKLNCSIYCIPNYHYIAYFDASNIVYLNLEKFLKTSNIKYLFIGQSCLYNLMLFTVVFGLVCVFSKRWIKNGI